MPSSSFVEIDIANNEAPIIDNRNVVITSEPRDPPEPVSSPDNKPKVSQTQSQEDETVVSPTPRKMKSVKNKASDAKKVASANDTSKAVVTPRAKSTTTTSSPPKGAVATPGTSAKKEKKKGVTLDSFFSKGKKKDAGTKPLINTSKAGMKIGKKGEGTNQSNNEKIVKKKGNEKKTPAKKSNNSKETEPSAAVRGKRSVLESVGEEQTIAKSREESVVVKSKKKRVVEVCGTENDETNAPGDSTEAEEVATKVVEVCGTENDETNAPGDSTEAEEVATKDVLAEPDDDKTVDLDQNKVPDTSYDSSSEQSLASEVERMEVVVGVVQVETPSPMKSSDEESKDAALGDAPGKKGSASKSIGANDPKAELCSVADVIFTKAENDSKDTGIQAETTALSDSTATVETCEAVPTNMRVSEVKVSQIANSIATIGTVPTVSSPFSANPVAMKETSKQKPSKSSSKAAATKAAPPAEALSKENSERIEKYIALRERYVSRAAEVASRSTSDDFVEEKLSDEELPSLEMGSVAVAEEGGFPDELLPRLLILVQGSNLPLSVLSKNALESLSTFVSDDKKSLTTESISSKIKLLAQRKPYLSGNPPPPSEKPIPLARLDCFEDINECYLWRWELSSIDLLPQKDTAKVKKARLMRKKLQSHHAAIFKLVASIDSATKWLQKNPTSVTPSPSVPALAKVSDAEEKVLKFERDEETARIKKETKAKSAQIKAEELAAKQREKKERLEQERLAAKKLKEDEKAAAAKAREEAKLEAKRKKEEERLKQQQEAEEKESKQKKRMMKFFTIGNPQKRKKTSDTTAKTDIEHAPAPSFEVDAFRSVINSNDRHATTAAFTKESRMKTKDVKVSVHITVLSDNPFASQPYDEEKVISVQNKYKFLGFHEDHRPPYHGTWSKHSSLVTGRRPFGKDTEYLNYDVDSEAEWEEEDEEGEDCDKSVEGEEEDAVEDDDNDSFLAAEDELGFDEEDDEESKNLRKKKLLSETTVSVKACVIAPCFGGICHNISEDAMETTVEGITAHDAMNFLAAQGGRVLTPEPVCLDALPPSDRDEKEPKAPATQKMSSEAMKVMAQFVHNSTVKSKEKIITELLNAHPTVASSRAQAMRELEVTADKRRLPKGAGVVWEVKSDHLNALGLSEKDLKSAPPPTDDRTVAPALKMASTEVPPPPREPSSAKPAASQPKHSKKRSRPVAPAASVSLFASFMAKGKANKKQKTE